MRATVTVDKEKCIHCGQCVKDCMQKCLSMNRDNIPEFDFIHGFGGCGACQHCMAVCPTGALSWGNINPETLEPVRFADPDDMIGMIKGRRSIRQYKDKDIPDDVLQKLGEMLAYPPRGGNCDDLRFSLIGSRAKMQEIREATYKVLNRSASSGNMLVNSYRNGRDLIYWNAPGMLIAYVNPAEAINDCVTVDPIISLTYAELYAKTLGFGAVWCDLATNMVRQIPEVQRLVEAPRGYQVGYVILIGEPAVSYKRVVQKDENVTRIIK